MRIIYGHLYPALSPEDNGCLAIVAGHENTIMKANSSGALAVYDKDDIIRPLLSDEELVEIVW